MGSSLQDNILVHLENPDPANRNWQMQVTSGILEHANNRANSYGLSYSHLHHFVQSSLAAVGEIMDRADPIGGYSHEVLQFTEDTMAKFVKASDLDVVQTSKSGVSLSQELIGLEQIKTDLKLVEASLRLAIEKIDVERDAKAASRQGDLNGMHGAPNSPSAFGVGQTELGVGEISGGDRSKGALDKGELPIAQGAPGSRALNAGESADLSKGGTQGLDPTTGALDRSGR